MNTLVDTDLLQQSLLEGFHRVRAHSAALAAPLSAEDCCVQSMPDASPIKWHLAHTSWFFETFILERFEPDFRPCHPAFRVLFNSYYNGVGDKHPRPQRGLLTRPALAEVLEYRRDVEQRIDALLSNALPRAARAGDAAAAWLAARAAAPGVDANGYQALVVVQSAGAGGLPGAAGRAAGIGLALAAFRVRNWARLAMMGRASALITSCRATGSSSSRLRSPRGW